jgi:hypothetical protein
MNRLLKVFGNIQYSIYFYHKKIRAIFHYSFFHMTSNLPNWRPYMGVKGVLVPILIHQIDIF